MDLSESVKDAPYRLVFSREGENQTETVKISVMEIQSDSPSIKQVDSLQDCTMQYSMDTPQPSTLGEDDIEAPQASNDQTESFPSAEQAEQQYASIDGNLKTQDVQYFEESNTYAAESENPDKMQYINTTEGTPILTEESVQELIKSQVEKRKKAEEELKRSEWVTNMQSELMKALTRSVNSVCNTKLSFMNYVHVTGKLVFDVDNELKLLVNVNELVRPVAFDDIPEEQIVMSKYRKKKTDDPTYNPRRRRGRPRKNPVIMKDEQPMEQEANFSDISDAATPIDDGSDYEPENQEVVEDEGQENVCVEGDMRTVPMKKRKFPRRISASKEVKCSHCSHVTTSKRSLRLHMKTCEMKQKSVDNYMVEDKSKDSQEADEDLKEKVGKLSCSYCKYTSNHSGHLRDHINRKHEKKLKYSCSLCPKQFITMDDLKRHMVHHDRKYECGYCNEKFDTKAELKEHAKNVHDRTGWLSFFKCKYCKKNMASNDELSKHIEDKHQLKCAHCDDVFHHKAKLVQHTRSKHAAESLTCKECCKTFSTIGAVNKHRRVHHSGLKQEPVQCDICGKHFAAKTSLYHHKIGVHHNVKRYKCDKCDEQFNFHHSLKLHRMKHDGVRPFACDICGKTYLTNTHLKSHVQAAHGSSKKYPCMVCNKTFTYPTSLKMHMRLHTGHRPYLCNICGRSYVNKSALNAHAGTHVIGKNFVCNECGKRFKTEILLKAHSKRHTDMANRFMCHICGATYMFQSTLDAHYTSHGNERNFKCQICDKTFKTYATMYSHKLVHRSDTPFVCNICGKAFKSKERRAAHEKRHSGLKPFACGQCGHCFPDKGGLSKHLKTVHAETKKFQCPVCSKQTTRADNLRVHMKIHGDPALLKLSWQRLMVENTEDPESSSIDFVNESARSSQNVGSNVQPGQSMIAMKANVSLDGRETEAKANNQQTLTTSVIRNNEALVSLVVPQEQNVSHIETTQVLDSSGIATQDNSNVHLQDQLRFHTIQVPATMATISGEQLASSYMVDPSRTPLWQLSLPATYMTQRDDYQSQGNA